LESDRRGLDPAIDVNETAAIAYNARESDGKSAAIIIGGAKGKVKID
jgi:deoxyhypusine synthase